MYDIPRILRDPISNNRIDFEKRTNKTLFIPSLIEGDISDVTLGDEIVIEAEIGEKIVSGKGLKHFIFLKNARVPTWVMDNHNHAFAFWHEAFWRGFIQKGSLLVHIDQHTDLATPVNFPPWKHPEGSNVALVEEYTNTDLTIADFIVPALSTGLISEALMITGEDRNGAGTFVWEKDTLKKTENYEPKTYNSLIVDIDLDYFSQGFDESHTFSTVQYWIEKADIITIATSPLFIEQGKALSMLKSLQSSLVVL